MTSCKEDVGPVTEIRFALSKQTVTESDGSLQSLHPLLKYGTNGRIIPVKLILSEPLADNVVINVRVDGTATQEANPNYVSDFTFDSGDGVGVNQTKLTILKGASQAIIKVRLWEDFELEYDEDYLDASGLPYETISIRLESVDHGPGKIDTSIEGNVLHTINIKEDDNLVILQWDNTNAPTGSLDMDIFVYFDQRLAGIADNSTSKSNLEGISIPAGFPGPMVGLGYVYRKGSASTLNYHVRLYNFGGTLSGVGGNYLRELNFDGSYEQRNINNYNSSNPTSQIEQTMVKKGLDYTNISGIQIPSSGSRMVSKPQSLNGILKKLTNGRISTLKIK